MINITGVTEGDIAMVCCAWRWNQPTHSCSQVSLEYLKESGKVYEHHLNIFFFLLKGREGYWGWLTECVSHVLYHLHTGKFLKKGHILFFFLQFCGFWLVAISLLFFLFWKVRERRCAACSCSILCVNYMLFLCSKAIGRMISFSFRVPVFFFFFVSTGSEQIAIGERQ